MSLRIRALPNARTRDGDPVASAPASTAKHLVKTLVTAVAVVGSAFLFTLPVSSAPASAATLASNDCGLPTQANPGDAFDGSFPNCWVCKGTALWLNSQNPTLHYYCTYNPSNGLTDLHYHRLV
ncbi:hypothetical protein [Actinomadura rupiterrae]|uniref:hypothetical protein n=1 Tax=Actinomadura rupiterrae TaxID=559627 RepID=UPI0020A245C1|nr:hypothetical protein [Actinomadura rupiterrae]MCP2336215.1 hypothetical protein [Actinomadura rupiterrae]